MESAPGFIHAHLITVNYTDVFCRPGAAAVVFLQWKPSARSERVECGIMTRADYSLLKDVLYFSHLEIIVAIVRLSKVTRKDQKKSTVVLEFTVSGSN